MFDGVMLLWFVLTAFSLALVALDIRRTPESPVLKWGFVLLTAYTGPLGALLYVLGCREPLPGLHECYTAAHWRQVLGSTMHCVAGDGVGILAGAVVAAVFHFPRAVDVALEYALGFGFGWAVFQSLFMRNMAGGSYGRALAGTFFPELLSMNCLMAGMVPLALLAKGAIPAAEDPAGASFWFVMSMALLVGFVVAYPMNWWLVSRNLKHGMMTVRRPGSAQGGVPDAHGHGHAAAMAAPAAPMHGHGRPVSTRALAGMTLLSFAAFGIGLAIAALFGRL